jgi:hypothetical protein
MEVIMSESTPPPNRRTSSRRRPKATSKVLCVTGKFGMGPNMAVKLLDISDKGLRLVLKVALPPGHEVEIGLQAPGDRRPTAVPGEVVWCVPMSDGNHCLGVRFTKPLKYALLQALSYL